MDSSFKKSFSEKEEACEMVYKDLGPCHHLYTSECFETIFFTEGDFKVGMTILAVCAMTFPELRILTFQLMGNQMIRPSVIDGEQIAISSILTPLKSIQ